jgi:type I restriction enzyme S subunit
MTSVARVSDLAEQIRGVSYDKEDASSSPRPGYLPVLRAGNISDDGLIFDDLVFVPAERIAERQKIRRNDVVIAASSGSLDVVGKAARALADYEGGFGAFCKVLRPGPSVDPVYFAHFFRTPEYRRRVSALAAGVNINNLRNEHLDQIPIPLPSFLAQRRIAEILDKADALRAKRRAALAQLDTLTQSIFLDMFGRPRENPKGWPFVSLMDVCSPKQWPTISTAELTETGFPVFGANGFIGNYTEYNHEEPTVLITCRGATCGTINVSPPKCYVTGNAMALDEPDSGRITIDYLAAVLRTRSMADTISGTAQPQITRQNLEHVKLPLPPLTLQSAFARRGAAVERVKSQQHESLSKIEAIFASLQHRAFRGELVSAWETIDAAKYREGA